MNKQNRSTVNKEELEKFSKIADEWWDETGKFKPLHEINPVRLEYLIRQIKSNTSSTKENVKVLDIGCGGGLVSVPLSKVGYDVTGLDASIENIQIAKTRKSKAKFIPSTIEELAASDEKFNVVLALEVVEHVDNLELFINSCEKVLMKHGILIISTINRTLKSMLFAKIGAEYILRWLPVGTHSWDKFLKPEEIQGIVQSRKIDMTGMVYSPISRKWSLSDSDLAVNYFLTFRK